MQELWDVLSDDQYAAYRDVIKSVFAILEGVGFTRATSAMSGHEKLMSGDADDLDALTFTWELPRAHVNFGVFYVETLESAAASISSLFCFVSVIGDVCRPSCAFDIHAIRASWDYPSFKTRTIRKSCSTAGFAITFLLCRCLNDRMARREISLEQLRSILGQVYAYATCTA